jgi:hypothetical protein
MLRVDPKKAGSGLMTVASLLLVGVIILGAIYAFVVFVEQYAIKPSSGAPEFIGFGSSVTGSSPSSGSPSSPASSEATGDH